MGMTIEKMYGSYSDADLNDWEKFPMNANVLTSSAFGAWLLRRDERRDKAISKADYEKRLKADVAVILTKLQLKIEETVKEEELIDKKWADGLHYSKKIIQQEINALKSEIEE